MCKGACLLNARLVDRCGDDLIGSPIPGVTRVFPFPAGRGCRRPQQHGDFGCAGQCFKECCSGAHRRSRLCLNRCHRQKRRWQSSVIVKGIGEWSAQYIAMRACRQFDAFPASDVGILRGLADQDGKRLRHLRKFWRGPKSGVHGGHMPHTIFGRPDADKTRDSSDLYVDSEPVVQQQFDLRLRNSQG